MSEKEELHYINALKTARQYLKNNQGSLDKYQLMEIYKKVKHAEYPKLDPQFRLENKPENSQYLKSITKKKKYKKGISFACIGPVNTCGKHVLKTLWWGNKFDEKSYYKSLESDNIPKAIHIIKNSVPRFIISTACYIVSFLIAATLGEISPFLFILSVVIAIFGIINFILACDRADITYKCHGTNSKELYELINGIYMRYTHEVGDPLTTIQHLKRIEQHKNSWNDIHKQIKKSEIKSATKETSR